LNLALWDLRLRLSSKHLWGCLSQHGLGLRFTLVRLGLSLEVMLFDLSKPLLRPCGCTGTACTFCLLCEEISDGLGTLVRNVGND
jgi:hypothetical protein